MISGAQKKSTTVGQPASLWIRVSLIRFKYQPAKPIAITDGARMSGSSQGPRPVKNDCTKL